MAYTALAIDLDGTLLDGEDIPTDNVAAVRLARDAGFAIIIATARWRHLAQRVEEQLGISGLVIACSGAQVYDPVSGRDIFDHRLPADFTPALFEVCDSGRCIATITFSDDVVCKLDGDPDPDPTQPEMRFVAALANETSEPPRVAVIQGTQIIARIREELVPRFASSVNFFGSVGPSGRPNLTITSVAADKGEALAAACAHLGIEPASVVAFGDAENDIEMFRLAGASVAMGQAEDHVKAEATTVTLSNDEAGVARAIEKLLATGAV